MNATSAHKIMNGKKVTYWVATLIVCGFMAFNAVSYLSHEPKLMAAFASLGYPPYFPMILGVAKLLGVLALLVPGLPRLKEWAYAGFTFTFLGAIFSHLASNQNQAVLMPAATLVVLVISYVFRPDFRRVAIESRAEVNAHIASGVPVR
ncbi:MAG: hypothetical protein JWM32_589 [Verrucomicrobia bacterium]|nr:hypothetical protein [Verrucomicrobiota bacterium]